MGCIIPPSLSVDVQDAGVDSPPSIYKVTSDMQELVEPGPVTFATAPNAQDQTVTLTLLDTDVDDALYARVYFDYTLQNPTAPRSICPTAASNGTAYRTTTCSLANLCLQSDAQITHLVEIVVFDREPIDTSKTIPAGGQSTTRTYQVNCVN
ncbi:MAG: hypothetical protein QM831_41820 [Kofleriaceae bacterium]